MSAALISLTSTALLVGAGFGLGILAERWNKHQKQNRRAK